ncbi:MAG: molybdopterin-guanine dinucleotide biosynthesis protein B [Rhizobiaceae bacterium]|nr:molybdopterin-guanine dinucleotide biosynthesis protein B [Rhizobiaceae bacterium]
MSTPVIGIAGWKNSGKTTLVERLVAELVSRGLRVATLKHAHHEFDIDVPGTDSYRHRKAGASEVAVISGRRWAVMHELGDRPEPTLEEMLSRLSPVDIVIVEGWKRGAHPKIEVRRSGGGDAAPLAPDDPSVIAVASDTETDAGLLPVFGLDDIEDIVDFILAEFGLSQGNS